jgi:hypothetical protein
LEAITAEAELARAVSAHLSAESIPTDWRSAAVVHVPTMLGRDDLDDQAVVLDPIQHSIIAARRWAS